MSHRGCRGAASTVADTVTAKQRNEKLNETNQKNEFHEKSALAEIIMNDGLKFIRRGVCIKCTRIENFGETQCTRICEQVKYVHHRHHLGYCGNVFSAQIRLYDLKLGFISRCN